MKNEYQYVGIMVDPSIYSGIPIESTSKENLALYEDAAKIYGLIPCYFRLHDIQPEINRVRAYVKEESDYHLQELQIPLVIHNRSFYPVNMIQKHLKSLGEEKPIIFNLQNRVGKYTIHQILMLDPELRTYLPKTLPFSKKALLEMIKEYPTLILKPNKSSIGRGIMKLKKQKEGWILKYISIAKLKQTPNNSLIEVKFNYKLFQILNKKFSKHNYLIQEWIPLATYQDRPFDLRVSVQRWFTGEWKVTGIIGKAARKGHFLSNVAQGGEVFTLETLLEEHPSLSASDIRAEIEQLSLRIATCISKSLSNIADIGLDLGITQSGKLYFIECNFRDQRYSFQLGGLHEEWKATYLNPIGYARHLLDHLKCTKL